MISYFAGRTHLEAVEHAARLALKTGSPAYVGLVRANPWIGPGEPLRYARWVTGELERAEAWKGRVLSMACVRPSEAVYALARIFTLRALRDHRRNR